MAKTKELDAKDIAGRAGAGLRTFKQFCADTGLSEGSLRWMVFNEQQYGLEEAGAVLRFHGRIFIDAGRFLEHLRATTKAPPT